MIRLMCLAFTLLFSAICAMAQPPFDPDSKSYAIPSNDGYRQRTNDDRYEGLYTKKVSSQIEMVSLTVGKIKYNLTEDEKLWLQTSSAVKGKPVGVTGRSFLLSKFYRFDLAVSDPKKREIPIKEVIGRNSIYAKNLGVYGYLGAISAPSAYVPIKVSSVYYNGSSDIYLTLVANSPQDKILWRYAKTDASGNCLALSDGIPVKEGGAIPANVPIEIPLVFPEDIKSATVVCVSVDLQNSRTKKWDNRSYKVLVP